MEIPRTEGALLQLLRDKVEESVALDYKRGEALTKAKGDLTKEVTKDVSAFANSAGGILIYGIAEGSDATKHLPESLSPVDRTEFSKERLEHLINNIQPRIVGIEIVPISLTSDPSHVAYVVAIPASTTAHQCTDKRYYRRFNFEAVAMEDYEIRDVMNRRSLPKIELEATMTFSIRKLSNGIAGMPMMGSQPRSYPHASLSFAAKNIGGIVARHVIAFIEIPPNFLKNGQAGRFQLRNFQSQPTGEYVMGFAKQGNPQWVPILPSLSLELHDFELPMDVSPNKVPQFSVPWIVHCDEAPACSGLTSKANVQVVVKKEYSDWITGP